MSASASAGAKKKEFGALKKRAKALTAESRKTEAAHAVLVKDFAKWATKYDVSSKEHEVKAQGSAAAVGGLGFHPCPKEMLDGPGYYCVLVSTKVGPDGRPICLYRCYKY